MLEHEATVWVLENADIFFCLILGQVKNGNGFYVCPLPFS